MSPHNFSPLQIGAFNSALDAAIRKAKLFIGELIPAEKQAVVQELENLKIAMPERQECAWCGSPIKPESTYVNPALTPQYGFAYCSQECADLHFEEYLPTPDTTESKQCDCMMQLETCNGIDCTNKISIP